MKNFLESIWDEHTPYIVLGAGLLCLGWMLLGDLI